MRLLLLPTRLAGDDLMQMARFESCSARCFSATRPAGAAQTGMLSYCLLSRVLLTCKSYLPSFFVPVRGTRPLFPHWRE